MAEPGRRTRWRAPRPRLGLALLLLAVTPLAAQQKRFTRTTLRQYGVGAVAEDSVLLFRPGAMLDTVGLTAGQGVTLRFRDVLVVPNRSDYFADTAGGAFRMVLPNQYLTFDAAGGQVLSLRLRITVPGGGLRYAADRGAFVGQLLLGLEDSLRPAERVELSTPIEVQVTGEVDRVDPRLLRLTHTNVPFEAVEVEATDPGDTVHIVAQPVFDPTGTRTPIPIVRPMVLVRVSPATIEGFGLAAATVTIRVAQARPLPVVVWTTGGRLASDTLSLSPQGLAVTTIRSTGLGGATVHAEFGLIAAGEAGVTFRFPWAFLIAAALGGIAGALARRLWGESRRGFGWDLAVGLFFGVIGTVLYAVGINLTGFEPSVRVGEAATFAVAFLSAAFDLRGSPKRG